ncbi:MAG: hypothetical protein M1823_004622 [Watsoniomyces obsoletus]|nr:MAG: hypothetical protein M1823_004622 [Watsoniomyces obsoletus]
MSSPPIRSGLGAVYANLLDPSTTGASISRAPVVFNNEASQEESTTRKQPINSAALRFQPTKRPQLPVQKPKTKPAFPKPPSTNPNTLNQAPTEANNNNNTSSFQPTSRTTIADWTNNDEDVNGFYGGTGEKRQRSGRKKRKKNNNNNKNEEETTTIAQNWDDIYDPSRPNNYEEYKNSDEKIREIRDWKDVLYAHRMRRKTRDDSSDLSGDDGMMKNQFAPPTAYSFAPPAEDTAPSPVKMEDDSTGEDAYMRRLRLSQVQSGPEPPVIPPPPPSTTPAATISRAPVRYNLPPAPSDMPSEADLESTHEQQPSNEDETDEKEKEEAPRSLRPGQKGFAERLMSKYGWTKGTGLGLNNSGIINPLRVQVDKSKKKTSITTTDDGTTTKTKLAGRGRIVGGDKKKKNKKVDGEEEEDEEEEGMFGKMSQVIVLKGMVDNMDLDRELHGDGIDNGNGGLMQEIGEECSEKYGRVERVFIHRGDDIEDDNPLSSAGAGAEAGVGTTTEKRKKGKGRGPRVFVKFTSQLSALRVRFSFLSFFPPFIYLCFANHGME